MLLATHPKRSEFCTPITPFRRVFGYNVKTQRISMVRIYTMDAEVLYFQMTRKFPSWTREFEGRLPLHFFNNLRKIPSVPEEGKRNN